MGEIDEMDLPYFLAVTSYDAKHRKEKDKAPGPLDEDGHHYIDHVWPI